MKSKKRILWMIISFMLAIGPVLGALPALAGTTGWNLLDPSPTGNALNGVTYGNGIYVAVGNSGTILTSATGTSWDSHDSGTTNLNGVACGVDSNGNNLFAAAGASGSILTSPDGATWTTCTSGTTTNLNGITYGGGQFVAVGDSGTILTSADGETWEAMKDGLGNPYTSENLYSATYGLDSYGNDILVVAGSNGTILSFLTLYDWSYNSAYSDPSKVSLYGLTFGWDSNGAILFAATGENGTILTSSDGETWSSQTSGTSTNLKRISYGGGQFTVVGDSGTILISPDGTSWSPQTSGTTNDLYGVACGSNRYVAVGNDIVYSDIVQAAGAAVITGVSDVGDNENGSDLEVSFSKAGDESLIKEYRIIVVPTNDVKTFNVVKASVLSIGNYTVVTPTGSNITATLDAAVTDINGDSISNSYNYKVYVLSVADGTNATVNTLSEPSAIITLKGVLERWNWANPKPTGNTLNGAAYGNGLYVVVGDSGIILTSPDGDTWTSSTSGETFDIDKVTYGKGRFVAVGSDGGVLTSTDGTVWNKPNTNIPWCFLTGVAYGEGLFVAVTTSNDEVYISPDGKTWTTKTASYFDGITYSSGQFVAVGGNGRIYTSDDGKTWALQSSGTTENLYGITSSGSGYVAVGGNGTIMTSPDGAAWSTITKVTVGGTETDISGLGMGAISSVTYGSGSYVAVASQAILTSSDGTSWTISDTGQGNCLYGVGYGNNLFVAVGDSGTILTSSAGTTWNSTSSGTNNYLYNVIHDGSRFIAAGSGGIRTSNNGTDWSSQSVDENYGLNGVAYGKDSTNQDLYVAVGSNGYPNGDRGIIMTSTDRAAWKTCLTRADNNTPVAAVAYGNGTFVAVGRNNVTSGDYGVILISSDGSSWSSQGDGSTTWDRLYSVAYGKDGVGNGLFVAVGYNGVILTSPDGATWTPRTSGVTYALKGVAYYNGQFIAVGSNGIILTSTDGTNWSGDTWESVSFNSVTYGNGAYVVVGESGRILTLSADYGYWKPRESGTSNVLYGVSYANGIYVAVGADGTILTTATGSGSTESPATADAANNSVSLNPASLTLGSSTAITAAGDRQSVAGSVYGDERYIPTVWESTESGKNGTFALSGSDYTSSYTPSSAGSYTVTATFQKQAWDGSAWSDVTGSTDTKTASLTVNETLTTADAANNSVSLDPASISIGSSTTITAAGDRQSVSEAVYGDERYIPTVWESTESGKNGTFALSGSDYTSSYTPSSAGSYTVTATFQKQAWDGSAWSDAAGAGAADTKSVNLTVNSSGGGGGGSGSSTAAQTSETSLGSVTTENGTATATIDSAKLTQELSQSGLNSVIIFAITNGNADRAVFNLTVADLKAIADNKSMLQLESPCGIYKLPAVEIDFGSISKQYPGISYKDIKVTVAFSKANGTNAILNGSELVGQPVSITVDLIAGGKTIELDEFTQYVERDLPVPNGSGFSTGAVIEEDGTLRPVPTKTVTINGKKYAAVFSRTNSVYCLVSKAVVFDDLAGHWAEDAVHDMASRLIINGVGSNSFAPEQDITRAEFAAIVVRALGLKASGGVSFVDVKSGDWYYGAVAAACKYGIVSGYSDGSFKPNNRITRQEAMVMVACAMKVAGMDAAITDEAAAAELARFTDSGSFSDWAKQAAAAVIRCGLVAGSEGYARPDKNITRAETAAIVRRLLEKAGLI